MKKIPSTTFFVFFILLFAFYLLVLFGCDDQSKPYSYSAQTLQASKAEYIPAVTNNRVDIVRVKTVRDGLAYNGTRAIYLITDKVTGKEFIGVSGIGIAETGSHSIGKISATDER